MVYDTFDDFVGRGSQKLLGSAVLLLGDRHAAEDLTQEALIRVYRAWPSIRHPAAVDSFAYRTLLRLSHRHRLRASNRKETPTDYLPDRVAAEADGDPDQELQEQVSACVRDLPERQRDTLVLRFYAGLTVEETAKAMACHTGTVKSQTAKGLNNLRAMIAADRTPQPIRQGDET